jgi:hypothetical protein
MSEADPLQEAIRQLEYDVEQIKVDISLIQNEELRVIARNLLFEKRNTILNMVSSFYGAPGEER